MLETTGEPARPRAYLRVGGISVARHQVSLALELGCGRIICIARSLDAELVALQHAAEQAGARFHVVTGARALSGLISAADEVIVLADGLFATTDMAAAQLEPAPGVLVQPVESGLPAGFERIDLNHAAGGAMHLPGRLVERLSDLPPDCDVASALQRIALQAGVPQRPLPNAVYESASWRIVRSEAEANGVEADWIRRNTASSEAAGPTRELATLAVRTFGPALLHGGSSGVGLVMAAVLLLLLALATGWFGWSAIAFAACAAAWALRNAAQILLRVQRNSLRLPQPAFAREVVFGWLLDLVIVAIILWSEASPLTASAGLAERAFPAVMLIAMVRLVPRVIVSPWARWIDDRSLLCIVLAFGAIGGLPPLLVPGLAAVLAVLGVAWPTHPTRLTRA